MSKIIIDVDLKSKEAQQRAVDLEKEISRLSGEQKKYAKELKDSNNTNTEAAKKLNETKRALKDNRSELNALNKVQGVNKNSLAGLRTANSQLRRELEGLDTSTKKGQQRFRELSKEIGKNQTQINKLDEQTKRFQGNVGNYAGAIKKSFAEIAIGVAAVVAAYRIVSRAITIAIDKSDEQLVAEKSLEVALGRTSESLLNQASALQQVTRFGDEAIIGGQAFLAQMGLEEEQIEKLTPMILDFAQAKGVDLKTAFDLVAKTVGSSTNSLSRYGIVIEGAAKSNERVESAVNALSMAFGGQAQAMADLGKGPAIQLDNAIGDLQESFGDWLNERLKPARKTLMELVKTFDNFIEGSEKEVDLMKLSNTEFNTQINLLKNTNLSQGARAKIIGQINDKYKDYLPNLLTEKSSLKEIEIAQKAVNDQMRLSVLQKAFREEMLKILNKEKEAQDALVNAEIEKAKVQYEGTSQQFKSQKKILEISEAVNTAIVFNTKTEIESLNERFKKLAEVYDLAFELITQSTNENTEELNENNEAQAESNRILSDRIDKIEKSKELIGLMREYGEEIQRTGDVLDTFTEKEKKEAETARLLGQSVKEIWQQRYSTIQDVTTKIGNNFGEFLTNQEKDGKAFLKFTLKTALDALDAIVNVQVAKMTAQAFAEADSVATFGATGLARVAILTGLMKAGVGAARAAVNSFDVGGYTDRGDKREPAGIVHKNEWVAPAWMTATNPYSSIIGQLEQVRKHGYQDGGFAARSVTQPVNVSNTNEIMYAIENMPAPIVLVKDILTGTNKVVKVKKMANS